MIKSPRRAPARWSCVTVDAHHRLCAGCTDSGPATTQWACRNCASIWLASGDQQQRCSITLVHIPQSIAQRRARSSCPLAIISCD